MKKTLGKTLKMIRESKGLSQKEVAEGVVSVAQLSRFERGISDVTADVLYICLQNMKCHYGRVSNRLSQLCPTTKYLFSKRHF